MKAHAQIGALLGLGRPWPGPPGRNSARNVRKGEQFGQIMASTNIGQDLDSGGVLPIGIQAGMPQQGYFDAVLHNDSLPLFLQIYP